MNKKSTPRTLLIFYILVGYVMLQFFWWSYLLIKANNGKWTMVVGEGIVFFILLIWGHIQVRKSFKRELDVLAQQRNFLHSVTHELKSPLASIRLQMETLLRRELAQEKQKEIITNAIADTDRLNTLIENILLAARMEDGAFVLQKENVDLIAVIEKVIAALPVGKKITKNYPENLLLLTDELAVYSIVQNLLENAIKYSPADGEVSISVLKEKTGKVILKVSDNGCGIPEAEIKNVFKKFYRIGNEETRKTKGTGLGLFIVKNLVDALGAEIKITAQQPAGSVFTVVF